MTDEEQRKLRAYYHSLLGQEKVLINACDKRSKLIEAIVIRLFAEEIARIKVDFPDLLPQFILKDYLWGTQYGKPMYHAEGILSYTAVALSRLKVQIDSNESTPVTQTRDFSFVKTPELRAIIERDYDEIQRAYITKAWKSVIILAGGTIEAILTDLLLTNKNTAVAAVKAPKKPDITEWELSDIINVAVELEFVSGGVDKLSHSVREYRNLVHPGNEIRKKLTFGEEEARIALEVLHIVHRDLAGP